ncbi:MAG: type II secretion system protein, partial [Chloroflexota bacterium]
MKEEGGFTLVELLVTIAILAVLFGVVTLTLTG